jgi:hypothetical protein
MTDDRDASVTRPLDDGLKNGSANAVVNLYRIDALVNEKIDRTRGARGCVHDDADGRRRGWSAIEDGPDEIKSWAEALAGLEFVPEELERRQRPAEISYRCHTVRDIKG